MSHSLSVMASAFAFQFFVLVYIPAVIVLRLSPERRLLITAIPGKQLASEKPPV